MERFRYVLKPFQAKSYPGLIIQDKEHVDLFRKMFGVLDRTIWLQYGDKRVKSKIHNEVKRNRIAINNGDFFGRSSPFSGGEAIILSLDDSDALNPTILIERESAMGQGERVQPNIVPDTVERYTDREIQGVKEEASQMAIVLDEVPSFSEEGFSSLIDKVEKAGKTDLVQRLRRNRKVTDELKAKYGFRCQICGNDFKDRFGVSYAEPHHIIPFSQVKEDDPRNIVVVCPNHHRMIERAKATFDYDNKKFTYPNGLVEELVLNKHV